MPNRRTLLFPEKRTDGRYPRANETPNFPLMDLIKSITEKPTPVEPMTHHEAVTSIIKENKPLTLKRALELGIAQGVQSINELHASVPGSYVSHIKAIEDALKKSTPKGVDANMSADVRISACLGDFPDEVLIKVSMPTEQGMETKYYLCPTSVDSDGNVTFGDAEEIDIQAQFVPHIKDKGMGKSNKQKVTEIEQQHERLIARDAAFFENVKHKQDRAEKRGRLPNAGKVFPTEDVSILGISHADFQKGLQKAIDTGEFNECVQSAGRQVLDGRLDASRLETEVTKGITNLAARYAQGAETAADIEQLGACDVALVADRLINGRYYIPKSTLKAAVERAKREFGAMGGAFCYLNHKSEADAEDPTEAVAICKDIEFDEVRGIVRLPKIEFLPNSDGARHIIETAKHGKRYGISAKFERGAGKSHFSGYYNETETLEYRNIRILGFDIVERPSLGLDDAFLYWL